MIKNKYTLLVLFVLSVCLQAGADSSATALKRLTLKMKKDKLSTQKCNELQLLKEKEKKREKENEDSHTEFEFKAIEYSLSFRNGGETPLNDLKIECRYFYTEKRQWRAKTTKNEKEQKHMSCFLDASLEPRSKITLETKPFLLESRKLPSGYYYTGKWKDKAEIITADPDGLWVKVRYKTADGSMAEQDFCDPKSLSSRVEWVDEEPKK